MFRHNLLFIKSYFGVFIFILAFHGNIQGQSFPYDIVIEPAFTIPGLDGVHSFAAAQSAGKWLILSGRRDGMHRGGGGANNPAFPSSQDNTTIYVADPVSMQSWSIGLSSLSTNLQNQLSSTNTSFYQDGNYLYIVGGYGADNSGNHQTYGYLTAIDVPSIITNIINGNSITGDFIQLADNRMKIAGGQLGKIGTFFYLVGGMELTGRYTQMSNPIYSSELRKFEIVNNGSSLSIANYTASSDTEFHRRDYNLIGQIFPDGSYGYMVSSGVFTPSDGVFYNPIEVKSNGYTVIPEATFKQEFSHYQSAKLAMYNPTLNEMHSIFFGGIAQYYYDSNGNKVNDTDVPFVKTISRMTRVGSGAYSESVFTTEMPVYLGAGSELFLDENLPMAGHEILDMDQLSGNSITVGYIFGGLESGAGDIFPSNTANSSASNKIYKVKLTSTVLPLDLINFQGTTNLTTDCSQSRIQLSWETINEVNVKKFIIEGGKYGNFEKIGEVISIGSEDKTRYQFKDDRPINGKMYYRLKIIDNDGSFKYSDIIVVYGCSQKSLEIYPNPSSGVVFITGDIYQLKLTITDVNNRIHPVSIQPINDGLRLDLSGLAAGVYYLMTDKEETYKIIKN